MPPPYNPMAYVYAANPAMAQMPGSTVDPISPTPMQTASDYSMALLGQDPISFDSQGRYGISDEDKRRASYSAASTILSGLTESLLTKNPLAISRAAASAGDSYQSSLDKASARNIANRTMQYNEARTRVEMASGLNELEKEQIVLDQMKKTAEDQEELRAASERIMNMAVTDLKQAADQAVAEGRMDKTAAKALVESGKLAAIHLRMGNGEYAQRQLDVLMQHDGPLSDPIKNISQKMTNNYYGAMDFVNNNPEFVMGDDGVPVLKTAKAKQDKVEGLRTKAAELDIAIGEERLLGAREERARGAGPSKEEIKRFTEIRKAANDISSAVRGLKSGTELGSAESRETLNKALAKLNEINGLSIEENSKIARAAVAVGGPGLLAQVMMNFEAGADPELLNADLEELFRQAEKLGVAGFGSTEPGTQAPKRTINPRR